MKNILIFLTVIWVSLAAYAGPRVIGNGGDIYALQFVSYADKVLLYLRNSNVIGLDLKALAKVIETAVVESRTEPLKIKGVDKDAINYPSENRIIFNRNRWSSMINDERLALVLHEYLGLLGKEDVNYAYSKLLLKDMTTVTRIRKGSDSLWVVCQDDYLVINTYEHRAGADKRAFDLTLIFGGWVFIGSIEDETFGPVVLKALQNQDSSFVGDVKMSYDWINQNHRLTIHGILNLNDFAMQLNSTLSCSEKFGER